jgi:hypothetical protein
MRRSLLKRQAFVVVCLILFAFNASSQVTVGMDEQAEKAALFQIKNVKVGRPVSVTDLTNASVDKNGGGLALPRVHLKSKTTLEPFIETTDMEWIEASINKVKEKHAGLMVYNLTTTGDFKPGIYVWDGSQWNITAGDGGSIPVVDAWLRTGNAGTTPSTHFVGTTDNNALAIRTNNAERMRISNAGNVGIGTAAPQASLHVEGNMRLTNTPEYSGANVLVVDNSGNIGVAAPEAPINKVLYVQSTSGQTLSGTNLTNLNAGTPVVVEWAPSEMANYGDLMTRNSDNSFTFNEKSLCEVSGYINYQPNAIYPTTITSNWNESVAAVNITIQYALASSPNVWNDLTGARHVFSGASAGGPIQSITVPAAIMTFNKNDKIRMVIKRPSSSFGLQHGTLSSPTISVPTGSKFSKGLKVTTM